MEWVINPNYAFYHNRSVGYIFNIPENDIRECTIDFVKFIRGLYGMKFTYEDFCKKIDCDETEGRDIFKIFRQEHIIISPINLEADKFQNTMFNVKFMELARFLTMDYKNKAVFLGFPYDLSVTNRSGSKFASKALRELSKTIYNEQHSLVSYTDELPNIYEYMYDIGDVSGVVFNRNGSEFSFLANVIFSLIQTSNFPIVFGGDHSISFSTIRGASLTGDIGIIHIDAHDDYFEFDIESWTDELHHGNYLGGFAHDERVKKVYCIGIRSLSPYLINNDKVNVYPKKTIFEDFDIDKSLKYYVSFDVDVIDPLVISGVGTPVPFGFSLDEIRELLLKIIYDLEIIGMDIVEFIPEKKEETLTICSLILECIIQLKNRRYNDN